MFLIDRSPSRRDLLIFTALLPVFFGLVGAQRWYGGSPQTAKALWIGGLVVTLLATVAPGLRRRLYFGWMVAVSPIAWVVSHAILLGIYALVATPTALVLRALGRDPMQRRFDRASDSYWVRRPPAPARERYFRQS